MHIVIFIEVIILIRWFSFDYINRYCLWRCDFYEINMNFGYIYAYFFFFLVYLLAHSLFYFNFIKVSSTLLILLAGMTIFYLCRRGESNVCFLNLLAYNWEMGSIICKLSSTNCLYTMVKFFWDLKIKDWILLFIPWNFIFTIYIFFWL